MGQSWVIFQLLLLLGPACWSAENSVSNAVYGFNLEKDCGHFGRLQ